MHLSEVLRLRAVPAAGVCLEVTRRCPLHCGHCLTDSSADSLQAPSADLLRFADSFADAPAPRVVVMSGGEPLLRPRLVVGLADRARAVGSRSYLLTGAFFAVRPAVPAGILAAVDAVDHVAVSMDVFHEREVPRAGVFRLLDRLLRRGTEVSVQAVDGPDPGYAAALVDRLRAEFGDRVPVLVVPLVAAGRAAAWLRGAPAPTTTAPDPCAMAAWPVAAATGAVTACCNERVVAGAPAPHLMLGHIHADDWPTIRQRCLSSPLVRALRTFGPGYLTARYAEPPAAGYCATCLRLPSDTSTQERITAMLDEPLAVLAGALVERAVQEGGALGYARGHGVPAYAELVESGYRSGDADGRDR